MNTVQELVNAQLQIECSVEEYVRDAIRSSDPFVYAPYWDKVPDYTIARCPICSEPYVQAVDTYSLYLWSIRPLVFKGNVNYSKRGYHRCKHFVGVHTFLNLNEEKPRKNELDGGDLNSSEPEVPMITPALLPDDIESYVVLHSLPICRISGDRFVPKYTLYMLTYYATDSNIPYLRRELDWTGGHHLSVDFFGCTSCPSMSIYWEEARNKPEVWNLQYWVDSGKLYWLDLTNPELPLSNNEETFPYGEIKGGRHGYRYKGGRYEVVHTHPTIEEHIESLKKQHPDLEF